MPSPASLFTYLLLSASCALATPSVTAVPLPNEDCSAYPGYDASTDISDIFLLQLANSDNTAIEGFSDTSAYSIAYNPRTDPKPTLRWGYITFPVRNDIGKTPLRCQGGALQARVPTDLTNAGAPTNYLWSPLMLSIYPYDASLLWKVAGTAPRLFEHYVDGVKQDGLFLGGYDNSTSWGLVWQPSGNNYYARLLGPNSADPTTGAALKPNETTSFIKLVV